MKDRMHPSIQDYLGIHYKKHSKPKHGKAGPTA